MVSTTDINASMTSQQRYLPFGQVRTDVASPNSQSLITDYGYTGQRNLDEGIGLMDYRARFYSPVLNRFIQPDTIVPDPSNPQAWNRFSYVVNSPINLNDPSGHVPIDCMETGYCGSAKDPEYVLNSQFKPKPITDIIEEEEKEHGEYHGEGTFEIFPAIPHTIFGEEYYIGCEDQIFNNDGTWGGTYCTTFDGYYLYENRDEFAIELSELENMPYTEEDMRKDITKHVLETGFGLIDSGIWGQVAFIVDLRQKKMENQYGALDFMIDQSLATEGGEVSLGIEIMIWDNLHSENGLSSAVVIDNGANIYVGYFSAGVPSSVQIILNSLTP